jgi:cobalamin biosynthesis protein CobT
VILIARASVIVAPASHGTTHGPERHEDKSDEHKDDPDGPQNRDLGKESNEQQDDSEDDHSLLLTACCGLFD